MTESRSYPRYAAGRRIKVPARVRTVRDMIRRHLKDEGRNQMDLSIPWNVKPATAKSIMSRGRNARPMSSQYIDALVEFFQLDEFDATDLHRQAAREAGYKIDGPTISRHREEQ